MHQELLASLRQLSDRELLARVEDLSAREREATVLLVAHLAELDTRDAHLRAGHGSLFAYCRGVLALSEQEAYNRIAVARVARRFPLVLDLLERGAVNLTTVRLLGAHLTPDNHRRVLDSAQGKSKAQVEEIARGLVAPAGCSLVRAQAAWREADRRPGRRPGCGYCREADVCVGGQCSFEPHGGARALLRWHAGNVRRQHVAFRPRSPDRFDLLLRDLAGSTRPTRRRPSSRS